MDQSRTLLYSDWELEAIVANINTERDDDFSLAIDRLQQGQFQEAGRWLETEISRFPWVLLAAAYERANAGDPESAIRYLRAVILLANDSLVQLWAWHAIRKLGKKPPSSLDGQVLGMVIEVPNEGLSDVLASYADGTARYINHQGGVILWEDYDNAITPLIFDGIRMARPIGELRNQHETDPVRDGEVRLTVLTPGGMYIWQGKPEPNSDVARLFAQQANLLRVLVRMALERRGDQAEEQVTD